jgi:hypothetical protein
MSVANGYKCTLEAYDDVPTPETLLVLPGDAAMFRLLSGPPSTE